MLNKLKVLMEAENDNVYDMIAKNLNDDDIKDYFLDKIDPNIDGDENIKQIIDAIPADGKSVTKDDIKKILESVVPVNLNALRDSKYDDIMESYDYDEDIVTEGNAWSMYVKYTKGKEYKEYKDTVKQAKAAYRNKDMKKANRLFREVKRQIGPLTKLVDKIPNDDLAYRFIYDLLQVLAIGIALDRNNRLRSDAKRDLKKAEIYCDYMIAKTEGKKVGVFKDYLAKVAALESADGIDYVDSDDFDDKSDDSETLYNDLNEALDTYEEPVAEQTLSLTESMDAMIADLDDCIRREW